MEKVLNALPSSSWLGVGLRVRVRIRDRVMVKLRVNLQPIIGHPIDVDLVMLGGVGRVCHPGMFELHGQLFMHDLISVRVRVRVRF